MTAAYNLKRFLDAQEATFQTALTEIKSGRKQSHWMWYIFPQVQGLGFSERAMYYAIKDAQEAAAFLHHTVLGSRLIQICTALLQLESNDAHQIFGSPDDLKLRSSMTLFASVPHADPVFQLVLDKFFGGVKDQRTVHLLAQQQ